MESERDGLCINYCHENLTLFVVGTLNNTKHFLHMILYIMKSSGYVTVLSVVKNSL